MDSTIQDFIMYYLIASGILLIGAMFVIIYMLHDNYKRNVIKNGYRTFKEYLKDGYSIYSLLKDSRDLLIFCFLICFIPIINLALLISLMITLPLTLFTLCIQVKLIHTLNTTVKCKHCEIVTRKGYVYLFNKEKQEEVERNCCPICEKEDGMSYINITSKLDNFPKIKNKNIPLYIGQYHRETISMKEGLSLYKEYRQQLKQEQEVEKKKNDFKSQQEIILRKYNKKIEE